MKDAISQKMDRMMSGKTRKKNGLTLPDGISFRSVISHSESVGSSGKKTLWISQRGYMDQTFVHLSDSSGNTLTLLFSPFSGSARVYDGYVEDI